ASGVKSGYAVCASLAHTSIARHCFCTTTPCWLAWAAPAIRALRSKTAATRFIGFSCVEEVGLAGAHYTSAGAAVAVALAAKLRLHNALPSGEAADNAEDLGTRNLVQCAEGAVVLRRARHPIRAHRCRRAVRRQPRSGIP